MCSPVRCRSCSKVTWSGCGQHVTQLKAQIPAEQWCECPTDSVTTFDLSAFLR